MKHTSVGWMIYLNHTLSKSGDRMWAFAVGLYLVILHPDSLILTATLGLSVSLGVIIFGSTLGKWIDRSPRLRVATTALFVENAFVILGSILLSFIIYFQAEIKPLWFGYLEYFLFSLVILAAVISNLGSQASDIAIERDWIVILSNGDERRLASLNSTMRSIDLTTHILAPLAMGQIITFGSPLAGAIFIGGWNLVSGLIEYYLLLAIYHSVPQLEQKPVELHNDDPLASFNLKESFRSWALYFGHPVRWAGLAFSLLFLTVMGFDSLTLGYIYSQGVSESFLGIITGCGAVFGITASLTFPHLRSRLGKYTTGNIGFGLNVIFLAFCVASVFGPGSPFEVDSILHPFSGGSTNVGGGIVERKSVAELWSQKLNLFYFVIGIVLARFGLWVADLSVTQIIQESVAESHRGAINGVQNSLNQFVDLIKFMLIICLSSVQSFGYLIIVSWVAMLLAWMLFILFVCTRRESLSSCPSMEDLIGEKTPLLLSFSSTHQQSPTAPPMNK